MKSVTLRSSVSLLAGINGFAINTTIAIEYETHDQAISAMGHCHVRIMLGFIDRCSRRLSVAPTASGLKITVHDWLCVSRNCARASWNMLHIAESHGPSAILWLLEGHILWKNMMCCDPVMRAPMVKKSEV